jgi:hypothetical protein
LPDPRSLLCSQPLQWAGGHESGGEVRQLCPHSFPRHAFFPGQALDEVGSRGGKRGVGGEAAAGQAGDLLQYGWEQAVPPLVMPRLVRVAAPAFLQGQREASVVEFET